MGNCMETCNPSWREGEITAIKETGFEQENNRKVVKASGFDDDGSNKGVMRVKILLTREELELLMAQLGGGGNNKGGFSNIDKRSLEEVLEEIERGRSSTLSLSSSSSSSRTSGWSPSLESIMEIPEVPDHMDRSSS
ncbi:uncharacterized protein LOC116195610 [Punica granatum]|uniref:Uncharacterized protein n=2 Tax=Punica granatum TaxID=22663 RepID=A0A218WHJ5_PUNGR|nr:uncharacterized protein LOC116195610 [Punica granatum]OWM72156.1 hypothetical protein CDL15_Pgr018039 [Punica granatum]PKI77908.1 hypothetical protein CRG98_001700 [Punica granatum]